MNTETVEKNWAELREKIKAKWSKFNDEEVDGAKGDLSQLAGKIQTVYGIAKDHADRQFEEFKKSVLSLIGQEAGAEAPKASLAVEPSATLPKPNLVIAPLAAKAAEPVSLR